MARLSHRNPNGHWCHCPWGPPNQEPYQSPKNKEHVGSLKIEAMWHLASKLDWLRGRTEDPEEHRFLNHLEEHVPEHDSLYPWLVRERKKGRLDHHTFERQGGQYQDPYPMTYTTSTGQQQGLDQFDLQTVQDWMKYKKKNKEGIDIMGHDVGQVMDKSRLWDQGGEVVHDFDEDGPEHGYHEPGMKVMKLRDRRDLRREGAAMNHCIGHSGQRYDLQQADGRSSFYSLRDGENKSHATIEFKKSADHYHMCPGCKQPTVGETDWDADRAVQQGSIDDGIENNEILRRLPDEHKEIIAHIHDIADDLPQEEYGQATRYNKAAESLKDTYPELNASDGAANSWARLAEQAHESRHTFGERPKKCTNCDTNLEGVKQHPVDLTRTKHPDARVTSVGQYYGPGDNAVRSEHQDLLNHWFKKHGHDEQESDGDREYDGEDPYEEEFEQWWPENMEAPPVEHYAHYPEWASASADGHFDSEWGGDDYERACSDASDHDLEWPLLMSPSVDHNAVISSMKNANPTDIAKVFEAADEHKEYDHYSDEPESLAQAASSHLDRKYPDSYKRRVRDSQDNSYIHPDDYFSKNLHYHLYEKNYDPQTGEYEEPLSEAYPARQGDGLRNNPPRFIGQDPNKPHIPPVPAIPDQTGPYKHIDEYNRYNEHELPYGRDVEQHEQPFRTPSLLPGNYVDYSQVDQRNREMGLGSPAHERAMREIEKQREDIPFKPTPPLSPEEAFGPATTERQRPLTDFDNSWGREHNRAYDPNDPHKLQEFGEGEQQGTMFPETWYLDHSNNSVKKSNLPPHLFKPENYTRLAQHPEQPGETPFANSMAQQIPGQTPMWRPYTDMQESLYTNPQGELSEGNWNASVKTAQTVQQQTPRISVVNPPTYSKHPAYDWRVPTIYDKQADHMYVGQLGQEHVDLARQIDKDDPWTNYDESEWGKPGYIDAKNVQGGGLDFFGGMHEIPNANHFHDWVEQNYGSRKDMTPVHDDGHDWGTVESKVYDWTDADV